MIAGLIAVAVAKKLVIAHPHEHTTNALGLLLIGGPTLFLAAQGWFGHVADLGRVFLIAALAYKTDSLSYEY
jgi:low temperature requirement protein LtrA